MVLAAGSYEVTSELHKWKYCVTAAKPNQFFRFIFAYGFALICVWLFNYKYRAKRFALDDRIYVECIQLGKPGKRATLL